MAKSAKQLREERATLITQARALNDEHADAQGNLPSDRQETFDKMMAEAGTLLASAERLERLEQAESGLNQPNNERLDAEHPMENPGRGNLRPEERKIAIRSYGRNANGTGQYSNVKVGKRGTEEYQNDFASYLGGTIAPERKAALQSDNPAQAGYLVASEQFASELLKEVDDLLFVRRYARIHTVREASSLGIRKRTAKASTFDWSAELQVSTEDSTLAYGKKVLTPHHLTGLLKVSRDLVRRSVMSADMIVREEFARDAGEKMEDGYLTGTGSQQPLGVFTASSDGISTARDVATGSTTSITADGLINAKYALKSQYRSGSLGAVRWLFHRDALKIIAKLKDSAGQYLLQIGLGNATQGGPPEDTLLGFPVDESERAPNTFTSNLYAGLLANWRYYEIADALDMEMQVLTEKYAETNQIGYIGRLKTDGMPTLEEAFVRLQCTT